MKLGVLLESFRLPLKDSVRLVREIGLGGIQIYADKAVHDGMSAQQIGEVKRIISGEGIEISALCGDFGCRMFYYPDEMRAEIEREKRIMALAKQLGTNIVTTHIGCVPQDENDREYECMQSVCRELAQTADSFDGHFAVETGPEPSERLRRFLDGLQSRGVGVNFDPANLTMVIGEDIPTAVHNLKDYIVHTHAKDGRMLKKTDPRRLYVPSYTNVDPADFGEYIVELPLGKGDVPWDGYLAALRSIGYNGYLTIEREVGDNPAADIKAAAQFLRQLGADKDREP